MSEWATEFDLVDEGKVGRANEVGGYGPDLTYYNLIKDFSEVELLRLRSEIDRRLPATLSDLDLERELLQQYVRVKSLQDRVIEDPDVPVNQLAQVAGQVASTLQQLVKMQAEYHTAERFKKVENLVIKHMKTLPLDVATAFLEDYERLE